MSDKIMLSDINSEFGIFVLFFVLHMSGAKGFVRPGMWYQYQYNMWYQYVVNPKFWWIFFIDIKECTQEQQMHKQAHQYTKDPYKKKRKKKQ